MLRLYAPLSLITFVLSIYCLIEAISTPEHAVRNLPKTMWVLLVLFVPLAGSIAWLVAGRPQNAVARRSPYERSRPDFPEYDRPGRAAATDTAKDEEFLRQVRARAEEQRKRYEQQRRAEQAEKEAERERRRRPEQSPEEG